MNTHIIHPKYQKSYKIENNSDFSKMLSSNYLDEFEVKPGIKMIVPKYYNDNHGFALDSFKDKLLFSKAIFVGESEQALKALLLEIYWIGYSLDIKNKEIKRLTFIEEKTNLIK